MEKMGGFEDLVGVNYNRLVGIARIQYRTVTLCPACFRAVAAVRRAIPAPTIRMFSWTVLPLEPIVDQYQRYCAGRFIDTGNAGRKFAFVLQVWR
jgi:hypothetical protein